MRTYNLIFKITSDDRSTVSYEQRRVRHQAGEVIELLDADVFVGSKVLDGDMFRVVRIEDAPEEVMSLLVSKEIAEEEGDLTIKRIALRRILLKELSPEIQDALINRVPYATRGTYEDLTLHYEDLLRSYVLTKEPEPVDSFNRPAENLLEIDQDLL